MKIKLTIFTFIALSVSAQGFAQSISANREPMKTSPSFSIDSQDIKHGPLVDFYELVGQYQFVKKEMAKEEQQPSATKPQPNQNLITDTKIALVRTP